MKKKISKSTVDKLEPDAARDIYGYDTSLTGFGVEITPPGTRTYIYEYYIGRTKRRFSIGQHGRWTPDQARREKDAF